MKKRNFDYVKIELCRQCGGTGYLEPAAESAIVPVCPVCNGSGRVKKRTAGSVTIEAYDHDSGC